MEHHVFLSYSHKDRKYMEGIREDLRSEDLTVWTDDDIEKGADWTMSIETAIKDAGCMVIILSPYATQSTSVREELNFAGRIHKKRIFPVLAHGTDEESLIIGFSLTQYTDIRDEFRYQGEIQKLIRDICNHLQIESKSQREARLAREEAERQRLERESHEQVEHEQRRKEETQALEDQHQKDDAARLQRELEERHRKEEADRQVKTLEEKRRNEPERQPMVLEANPSSTPGMRLPVSSSIPVPPPAIWLNSWNPIDQFRLLKWLIFEPQTVETYQQFPENNLDAVDLNLVVTLAWIPIFIASLAFVAGRIHFLEYAIYAYDVGVPPTLWLGLILAALVMTEFAVGILRKSLLSIGLCVLSGLALGYAFSVVVGLAGGLEAYTFQAGIALPTTPLAMVMGVVFGLVFGFPFGIALAVSTTRTRTVALGIAFIVEGCLKILPVTLFSSHDQKIFLAIIIAAVTALISAYISSIILRRRSFSPANLVLLAIPLIAYALLIWIYWFGGWITLGNA